MTPDTLENGADNHELGEIVEEFNAAQADMMQGDHPVSNLFQPPGKTEITRLADKVKAYTKIRGWDDPG